MQRVRSSFPEPIYIPVPHVERLTAEDQVRRIAVATVDAPTCICGVAIRVGTVGFAPTDLALYRLKIRERPHRYCTLSPWYVVEGGRFLDAEDWKQQPFSTLLLRQHVKPSMD